LQATQAPPAISDDAKRMSYGMNMLAILGERGKWASFALADGRGDNTPYDTREDAVRHRRHDRDNYVYLLIPADGMSPQDAQRFLDYARMLHDNGYRLPDPRDFHAGDANFPVHDRPLLKADAYAQIRELTGRRNLKGRLS
jgi:hypothetical protein